MTGTAPLDNNADELITMTVPHEGSVAAGRVIAFETPSDVSTVFLPKAFVGSVGTLTVSGDSLEDVGIFDGDKLIVKKVYRKTDIKPDTICVVYLPASGELVAKRVTLKKGVVYLRSCKVGVPDMAVRPEECDIRGVVIGFQRFMH